MASHMETIEQDRVRFCFVLNSFCVTQRHPNTLTLAKRRRSQGVRAGCARNQRQKVPLSLSRWATGEGIAGRSSSSVQLAPHFPASRTSTRTHAHTAAMCFPSAIGSLPPGNWQGRRIALAWATLALFVAAATACGQRGLYHDPDRINIACVGDSITYGAHSSGGNTTYPAQLQLMLDAPGRASAGKYCVSNLGESGATMQKAPFGDSPYWQRPSFGKLVSVKWDVIVLMLGTNDAKDACGHPASFCRNDTCCNWPHAGQTNWTQNCSSMDCPFVESYRDMLSLLKTLGTSPGGPDIRVAVPPSLMEDQDKPCVCLALQACTPCAPGQTLHASHCTHHSDNCL